MSRPGDHYELHQRRRPEDDWAPDHAGFERRAVLAQAEAALAIGSAHAVRVVREVFDPETGEAGAEIVLEKALPRAVTRLRGAPGPPCRRPDDLLGPSARARLAHLFEVLLERERITVWELLHRADLAESLAESGVELQGVIQRAAVREAHAWGVSTHEMVRALQPLADATLARMVEDGRRGRLAEVTPERLDVAARALCEVPDGAWRLGGGVAAHLRSAQGWREKTGRLAAFLAAAPAEGRARAFALEVLEPPLAELLATAPLDGLAAPDLDLGGRLAALLRVAAGPEVEALAAADDEAAALSPPLEGMDARLARALAGAELPLARAALTRRILLELGGAARLRPDDARAELALFRVLAAGVLAASGRLFDPDAAAAALVRRSRRLVAADFVTRYVGAAGDAFAEAEALVRLCAALRGAAAREVGGRWLLSVLESLRFEREVRGDGPAAKRLARLASLQREASAAGLPDAEAAAVRMRLGEAGGWVDEAAGVTAGLAASGAPALQRLAALMRLGSGDAAPVGPVTRAATEAARRLARTPEIRAQLAARPEALEQVRAAAAVRGAATA